MAGVYGVDESKKIAEQIAKVVNTGFKMLRGNVFAVFELVGPVNALRTVNLTAFKNEVRELDVSEREVVEQSFTMALDLSDKVLQEKLTQAVNLIEEAAELIDSSLKVVDSAKEIVTKFTKLLGV